MNAFLSLGKLIHEMRHQYNIPQLCDCPEARKYGSEDIVKLNGVGELLKNVKEESKTGTLTNGSFGSKSNGKEEVKQEGDNRDSNLEFFADVALGGGAKDVVSHCLHLPSTVNHS